MVKKNYVLTEQALKVLKRPDVKPMLMVFFRVRDARTIDSYIANNVPYGPLMNIHVKELLQFLVPDLPEKSIYRRLTPEEEDALNRTMPEYKQRKRQKEQDGENH